MCGILLCELIEIGHSPLAKVTKKLLNDGIEFVRSTISRRRLLIAT